MKKIGVTGGIGSGKTTFVKELERLGAFVLYADAFAKELMMTNTSLKQQIIDEFGEEAYLSDGNLHRSYLAQKAFNEGKVERLNELVHPLVYSEGEKLLLKAEQEGFPLAVKEAALLLDKGKPKNLDKVIVILAPREAKIKRVQERDGVAPEAIEARMNQQKSDAYLVALADIVIVNDDTEEALKQKARDVFQRWKT